MPKKKTDPDARARQRRRNAAKKGVVTRRDELGEAGRQLEFARALPPGPRQARAVREAENSVLIRQTALQRQRVASRRRSVDRPKVGPKRR